MDICGYLCEMSIEPSNVEKMSVGRMHIIVDTPGRHKASLGIFDMVRSGAYEMGHMASYYYKDKDPATTFLRLRHLV